MFRDSNGNVKSWQVHKSKEFAYDPELYYGYPESKYYNSHKILDGLSE